MENYARLMAGLAADLGCDVVVGHSMGANVALEMARRSAADRDRRASALRAAGSVLLRADAADPLEGGAEREGAAVADL